MTRVSRGIFRMLMRFPPWHCHGCGDTFPLSCVMGDTPFPMGIFGEGGRRDRVLPGSVGGMGILVRVCFEAA